jgi:lipoprotein-anchoring transpeptidase ErfK/SrfK
MKLFFISLFVLLLSLPLFSQQYVLVNLSEQMAYAIEDDSIMFEGRISSGKKGRETPAGEYMILQKKRHHKSNLWPRPKGGAKMPYMMRLSNDGIAMHLGYVPKRAASHGCIRLKNGFAQEMFAWAKVGTKVFVEGDAGEYGQKSSYSYDDDYAVIDFHD